MALDLKPGDEVIVPAFTYVAPAEAIALLQLVPVIVDVDPQNFNMAPHTLEQAWSPKTKAVIPVHLFGQCANMEPIMQWAKERNVYVIEDVAQALGARYVGRAASKNQCDRSDCNEGQRAGTLGDIGCTSFFPTKNLGCYGDGGALMTKNSTLAERIERIARHGQQKKYIHEVLGCNSRLDTLQAAILDVKLNYLDRYEAARYQAAQYYTQALQDVEGIICPLEESYSTHVYHQYTLRVLEGRRDGLQRHLAAAGIPTVVYYPLPVHKQAAFASVIRPAGDLSVSEQLCREVLSLPMHTQITREVQQEIVKQIKIFIQVI
jgi:dTDP-4-amino-4,6-dideoxygalactose transaminase